MFRAQGATAIQTDLSPRADRTQPCPQLRQMTSLKRGLRLYLTPGVDRPTELTAPDHDAPAPTGHCAQSARLLVSLVLLRIVPQSSPDPRPSGHFLQHGVHLLTLWAPITGAERTGRTWGFFPNYCRHRHLLTTNSLSVSDCSGSHPYLSYTGYSWPPDCSGCRCHP